MQSGDVEARSKAQSHLDVEPRHEFVRRTLSATSKGRVLTHLVRDAWNEHGATIRARSPTINRESSP